MIKVDQQSKGSQSQALSDESQTKPPADQQTTPGKAGGEKGEPWYKDFTPEQWNGVLSLDREAYANKKHGKLRTELAAKSTRLAQLETENPLLSARVKELEALQDQWEDEAGKKNPDIAEINRTKREYRVKAQELAAKERALQLSLTEHGEDLKKLKAQETKDKATEIADEFGIPVDDLMDLNPTSEEQMRAFAEKLGTAKRASESKASDSGNKGGAGSEKNPEDMTPEEYAFAWRKKHPIK